MADEHTYYLRQRPLPVSVSDQSLYTVDTPISSVAVSTSSNRLDLIPTYKSRQAYVMHIIIDDDLTDTYKKLLATFIMLLIQKLY